MRRVLLLVAGLSLLAVACGDDASDRRASVVAFDAARATAEVDHLAATIGPRPAGSEAAAEAAGYLTSTFGHPGFGVFRQNFTFEVDPNRPATVKIGATVLPAATAGGSAAGTVTGPAVDVGTGAAISAGSLAGKVAVVTRGGSSFREKYEAVRAGDAAALVIVNNEPGELIANLGATARFPVVTVAGADGVRLLGAGAAPTVTVDVPAPQTAQATNVVARATSAHACVYVLTANYDSLPGSPGANDNASGVAVLLELSRGFAALDDVPAVCLVAVDGGFAGGLGAARYVSTLTQATQPAVVISLRAVGTGGRLTASGDPTLGNDAAKVAEDLGIDLAVAGAAPASGSAAEPFRALGVATLEIGREGVTDRADPVSAIDAEKLREAGLLAGELMARLSAKSAD